MTAKEARNSTAHTVCCSFAHVFFVVRCFDIAPCARVSGEQGCREPTWRSDTSVPANTRVTFAHQNLH